MLIEQYFFKLFKHNKEAYENKRIALYGACDKTGIIINQFPDYNFVAVLDKDKEGVFCGLPIITPEQLPNYNIEVVIIVARNQSVAILAERIKDICEANHIKVYSISGISMYDFGITPNRKVQETVDGKPWREKISRSFYCGVLEQPLNSDDEKLVQLFAEKLLGGETETSVAGKVKVNKPFDFAYCFLAPIITTYVFFIINQLKEGVYDKVLFAARDCYLIQKLYNLAKNRYRMMDLPEDYYFYTSRMACITAATQTDEDLFYLDLLPYSSDSKAMLEYRFGINAIELDDYEREKYSTQFNYLMTHKKQILTAASQLRENYLKYMQKIQWNNRERYAFVDLISSGTCQMLLSTISDTWLKGIYLGRQQEIIKGIASRDLLPVSALYDKKHIGERNDWQSVYLFEHYWFLETVMTSFEPSLHHFDKNGTPIFSKEKRTEEDFKVVTELQQGIEAFFCDYMNLLDGQLPNLHSNIGDILYRYSGSEYSDIQIDYFEYQILYEDLVQGELRAKDH